jgi:hypothetical protein
MSIGSTSIPVRPRSTRTAACIRIGLAATIACAPVTAVLAQSAPTRSTQARDARTSSTPTPTTGGNQTRQTDGQRQLTPGRLVVPVTGTLGTATAGTGGGAEVAAETVNGTFAVQRFARTTEDAVAAVGTLTLTFTDQETKALRTIVTQAAMPVTRSAESTPGTGSNEPPATTSNARACQTLRLTLGPIEIAPIGVAVQIDRTTVDITALPGLGERLAEALCSATSQIGGAARPAELLSTLNALLDMLG